MNLLSTGTQRVLRRAASQLGALSLRDLHLYGGLGIAAAGGWQLSPAITTVAVGVTLMLLGLVAPFLSRGE